jgi:hypothetical protein
MERSTSGFTPNATVLVERKHTRLTALAASQYQSYGSPADSFGDLPNSRKVGARYRLRQILQTVDPHKSSASSAASTTGEKSAGNSGGYNGEKGADDSADDLRMGQVVRAASARQATENNHNRINGLPANAADGADNADDSGKPGADRRDATLVTCAQCGAGPSTDPPSVEIRDVEAVDPRVLVVSLSAPNAAVIR